jgi:radical S-adenosyl methionine domain-containing protein 2
MLQVPEMLRASGCEKITFVGGEPTLCKDLPKLLRIAKDVGLTTMIVTNGTTLRDGFLAQNHHNIDWVSLSVDSQFEDVEHALGRGNGHHVDQTIRNVQDVHDHGLRLKLNSVVTKLNYAEDMTEFILSLEPQRWKVFQVLRIIGENDGSVDPLLITAEEFSLFKQLNEGIISKGINAVFEDTQAMTGSYVMMDPMGRFFDNVNGRYHYSRSISEVGVEEAFRQVRWDAGKFVRRNGLYDWEG